MEIEVVTLLACLFALQPVSTLGVRAIERPYHRVSLAQLKTTFWTHVEICGPVVYSRRQRDGDLHVTIDDGTTKVVAEFLPSWIGGTPKKGQLARVRGIVRIDRFHKFAEVHPVEGWDRVTAC